MNAVLCHTAVCDLHSASAVDSAASAGMQCLSGAGVATGDVNVLINVGVYRENNIMEPSVAALIQQKMELNPDPAKNCLQQRTLSYDLVSGATGFLNAAMLANSLLQTGAASNVLIVAADVHPSGQSQDDFPFSTLGMAVLLQRGGDDGRGFGPFLFKTAPAGSTVGYSTKGKVSEFGMEGRSHAVFTAEADCVEQLGAFAIETARDFLQRNAIAPEQIDILVASQVARNFPHRLAQQLGLPAHCYAVDLYEKQGDPHTAAPGACLHHLLQDGLFQSGKNVLFVSVGSGLSAACALYRA